ncbi:MAG: hypothetical protein AAGA03_00590 [Planctomycetota bacterium]
MLNPSPFRRHVRRGVAEPVSSIALAAVTLTVLSLASRGIRGHHAFYAAEDFRTNSTQLADGMRDLLELKYQRMRDTGQLTGAEYQLAMHRMDRDSTDQVFRNAANELVQKQVKLADDAFWDVSWDAVKASLLTAIDWGGEKIVGAQETILQGIKDADTFSNFIDTISSFDGALGTLTMLNNPYLVTQQDLLAAIEQAGQRIQSRGDDAADINRLLSLRVRSFFDKWCADHQVIQHMQAPNHEYWVKNLRVQLRQRCDRDFANYVRSELEPLQWSLPPPGLLATVQQMLVTSKEYINAFGRDYSGKFSYLAAPIAGKGPQEQYQFEIKNNRDGSAQAIFLLPANIDISELPKIGLPASRALRFPLTAKIESDPPRVTSFYNKREINTLATAFVKFGVNLGEALASIFGGPSGPPLANQARAEGCVLSFRPLSVTGDLWELSFKGDLVIPERSRRGVQLKRESKNATVMAKKDR